MKDVRVHLVCAGLGCFIVSCLVFFCSFNSRGPVVVDDHPPQPGYVQVQPPVVDACTCKKPCRCDPLGYYANVKPVVHPHGTYHWERREGKWDWHWYAKTPSGAVAGGGNVIRTGCASCSRGGGC